MKKNLFIAFEGIDGSGKSTQIKMLAEKLAATGMKVYTTHEPTGGPIGKIIRDIFNHRQEADQHTIAALFVADRLEHLLNKQDGILKKLEDGYMVITDRYYFSSYAYHSVHVDMDWVIEANKINAKLRKADLNIYIDITPEVSMVRLNQSRDSKEMYETLENQQLVYKKYEEAFGKTEYSENILRVNGNQSAEKISEEIFEVVSEFINPR